MSISQNTNRHNSSIPPATRAFTGDMLDSNVLKAFATVKSDNGSDIIIELIDLYLRGTSQRVIEMRKAADDGEWIVLKHAAHSLKGSSSTLGLHQIAKLCRDIEAASLTCTGDAHALISSLESKFLEVKPVLLGERNRRMLSPEGIFQATPSGRFIAANPAMARILGFESPSQLIAEVANIANQLCVQSERRGELQRLIETSGMVEHFELEFYRRDRSTVWVSTNVKVVRDENGSALFYQGSIEDITERKRAEKAERELVNRVIAAQEEE